MEAAIVTQMERLVDRPLHKTDHPLTDRDQIQIQRLLDN